jgi:hypothetical protein
MKDINYVPILKGKEGEFGALEMLTEDVRQRVTPLVEVPGIPYDWANERPSRTLDEHVSGLADRLARSWGRGSPFYLDLPWFENREFLMDGSTALQSVLGNCREFGLQVIPVISLGSSPEYLAAASEHAHLCGTGVCLRIVYRDFNEDSEATVEQEINRVFEAIQPLSIYDVDLVLDLEEIGLDLQRTLLVTRALLSMVPDLEKWRFVVLAAASFPEDLSNVEAATVSMLPRVEHALWAALRRRPAPQRPNLVFADYAISHPQPKELDPRTIRMSANIRYTTDKDWLIAKGKNVRQYGYEQYFHLCRALVSHPLYSGATFSWGDDYIARCANGEDGPGNATTWRKVGTNHHITFVARQLASPLGS